MMPQKNLDTITVVIADDHEIFRDGLKLMLSKSKLISLAGEAANGAELVAVVDRIKPDVVITDIKMPIMDGIAATRNIKSRHPDTGVIAFSMFDEDDLIIELIEAGGSGYLLKNADKEEVLLAIETVATMGTYYCSGTSRKMAKLLAAIKSRQKLRSERPDFSEKELEVIQLICQEYTNKEIGETLFMSARTVEGYRQRIQDKMNVKNSVGLVVFAIQHGLFKPEN